jgi:hypothetical protein
MIGMTQPIKIALIVALPIEIVNVAIGFIAGGGI